MGNLVETNKNVNYILLEKFIFLRILKSSSDEEETPIRNLIGYLGEHSSRINLYYDVIE